MIALRSKTPRLLALAALAFAPLAAAQDRDTKVRNDREDFADDARWIYNDLAAGKARAKAEGKPILAVIRCIP